MSASTNNTYTPPVDHTVYCAFCGHAYADGTSQFKGTVLADHIRVCPEHPIGRELRSLRKLQGVEVKRPDLFQLSEHDRDNLGPLLQGEGDWWSAQFVRIIAKSDVLRRARLHLIFPSHVEAVEAHLGLPTTIVEDVL